MTTPTPVHVTFIRGLANKPPVEHLWRRLVEHQDQFVRYRAPTDGGASGSPACTSQLRAFAIHRRALVGRELNEGIVLGSIKAAL